MNHVLGHGMENGGASRRRRSRAAAAAFAAASLAAPAAHASEGGFINPGLLLGFMAGPSPAVGVGGELSYMHYWDTVVESFGAGAFVQAQSYDDHGRYAFGLQGGSFLGAELGAALRESNESFGRTWGIHAGAYGSIGVLTLGLRATIPVWMDDQPGRPGHGGEFGLVIGLKLPIPVGDPDVIDLRF
ncbi:MAG: hypothetical protein IT372_03720 [Polyangiaceae bacterium]|nr:hypothetical protein [Polyangiaceae bacterium]